MKFICQIEDLIQGIGTVSRALSTKSPIPSLEGIYLKAGKDGLFLMASDLSLSISTCVPSVVAEEGEIVVPGRLFSDLVRRLPSGEVEMETDGLSVKIRSGKVRYSVAGMDGAGYPTMPEVETVNPLVLNTGHLRDMIRSTLFACGVDENKPILTGVLFEITEEGISVVALDGYRMALYRGKPENERVPIRFVVPSRYLQEIARALGDNKEDIILYTNQNQLRVDMQNTHIVTRLLEGDYIQYQTILPQEYATQITLSAKDLLESMERANLMATVGRNNLVKLTITENLLSLTANSELGDVYEEVEIEMVGKELEIAFNARYFLESLRAIGEERIHVNFNSNINPCVILPAEKDHFLHLVLPVRIYGQ